MMELPLVASLGMQATRYPSMLQMVEAEKLDPKAMITETVRTWTAHRRCSRR